MLLAALRSDSDAVGPRGEGRIEARSRILRLLARVLRGRLEASPPLIPRVRLTRGFTAEQIGQAGALYAPARRRRRIKPKTRPRGKGMPIISVTILEGSGIVFVTTTPPVPPKKALGDFVRLIKKWFDNS